jgi:hypothetical protein
MLPHVGRVSFAGEQARGPPDKLPIVLVNFGIAMHVL